LTEEIWKDIMGFEGFYQVSNLGKVFSRRSNKILKTYVNNSGYECIDLRVNNKRYKDTVHRLVARAFCDGYEEGKVVNHIDTNRLHNAASNLEWMTYKESIQEMKDRGALNTHKAREALKKVVHKKVDMYTKDGSTYIRTFNSLKEAAEITGAPQTHLSSVVKGRRFSTGGYHWKYHEPNKASS